MVRQVHLDDIIDIAIIQLFGDSKGKRLQASKIARGAYKLIKPVRPGIKEQTILRRIYNRLEYPRDYLIKAEASKDGIYIKNPEIIFLFDPLPTEIKSVEVSSDKMEESISVQIPAESRMAHTADLKAAIKWWRDYIPKPPGSGYSFNFFTIVEYCEKHQLYPDLINHLPQSGFDVCSRWDQYKNDVKELDNAKKDLLSALEKAVSDIFADLQLNYVEYYDSFESFDSCPHRLNDFDCSLPSLVFDHLLFCLDIDIDRLNSAETEKKYMEILSDEMEGYNIWYRREERIKILPILEDGDSAIWGEDGNIELIRVPKGQSSSLIQGKEKALSLLLDGPDATINNKAKYIIDKTQFLEKEIYDLIQELDRSLYSKCFSGDCKYLGA